MPYLHAFSQKFEYFSKKGSVTFEPLVALNFIPNFRKIVGAIFSLSPKNRQKWHKLALISGFRENARKNQKSGRAMFLALLRPNFMPSFREIVGAVFMQSLKILKKRVFCNK